MSVVLEDMDEGNTAHPGLRWPSCAVSQSVRLLVEKIQYLVPARSGFRFKPATKACLVSGECPPPYDVLPWGGSQRNEIYNVANRRLDRASFIRSPFMFMATLFSFDGRYAIGLNHGDTKKQRFGE